MPPRQTPPSTAETLHLLESPFVDLRTANRIVGVGDTTGYDLAARGEYPVPVIRVGGQLRVASSHLLELAGLAPAPESR